MTGDGTATTFPHEYSSEFAGWLEEGLLERRGSSPGVMSLLLGCLLPVMLSGCMTTLGYVPEYVKATEDKETGRASYKEVKKWATDVLDGYDSRATLNRHAIYAGAVLAAASVSAIAGLAAFGSNSSALIGIPIGTGFLGAVAAVYQSDEKAAIYGHGGRYVKDLIVLSEDRTRQFDEDVDGSLRVAASQDGEAAARRRLVKDQQRHTAQSKLAEEARRKADAAKADPTGIDGEKTALEKAAQSLKDLADQAQEAVTASESALRAAEARTKSALRYQPIRASAGADEKKLGTLTATFLQGEAICLQQDVNAVMGKVADHIAVLDPKDLAARLKAVKADAKTGTGTAKDDEGAAKSQTPRIPPADLSDLALPAKSSCVY